MLMEHEGTTGMMGEELEGRGARVWWAPDRGAWVDSGNPGGLSVGEQPGQIHIFERHLWGGVGKRLGGGQEAGRGAG